MFKSMKWLLCLKVNNIKRLQIPRSEVVLKFYNIATEFFINLLIKIQGKHCTTSLASHNVTSWSEHVNMNKILTNPFSTVSWNTPALFAEYGYNNLLLYFGELLRVNLEQTA